jgi:excisionase family DNA binding protein
VKLADRLGRPVSISEYDRALIEDLAGRISRPGQQRLRLVTEDGQEYELPESVHQVLRDAVHLMASGESVALVPIQSEVSPQQAATILKVSRPYVTRLLDDGVIAFHRVGSHRRIKLSDLLAYKERRDRSREEDPRRLSRMSREMGIPE